jgi:hypothetical protein
MSFIRPRISDHYNVPLLQNEVDFAIPFLDEDIPLYVDPFLLWKSPSQQDNALHTQLISTFNRIGELFVKGKEDEAISLLTEMSECNEVGLGLSKSRTGKQISSSTSRSILSLNNTIPQISSHGFNHFEQIQILVEGISKDRISDFTCSLVKSFLIDYTIDQCYKNGIPLSKQSITRLDYTTLKIIEESVDLPLNPVDKKPLLFVPKRWLRYIPWINYEDYFANHFVRDIDDAQSAQDRIKVLNYNRNNYDAVDSYIVQKERISSDWKKDPLFKQIPILSAKRALTKIKKTPTGNKDNADKIYEDVMVNVLSSFLYPHLDFAQDQSRIESGTQIRDLIFYNNRSFDFLKDIYDQYEARQIVVELKNVESVQRDHVNQLNRYMADQFGRFGIIFTRNPAPKNILKNTIDLWSGQRRCIIILDDSDLGLMCQVFENKQRYPVEVIKKKYIEFTRQCPG